MGKQGTIGNQSMGKEETIGNQTTAHWQHIGALDLGPVLGFD